MEFTLEEIYLIRCFHSPDKNKIISELKTIRKRNDDPDIVEMADNAVAKLKMALDKEFTELMNYPL